MKSDPVSVTALCWPASTDDPSMLIEAARRRKEEQTNLRKMADINTTHERAYMVINKSYFSLVSQIMARMLLPTRLYLRSTVVP
jgi:hypothetical protein